VIDPQRTIDPDDDLEPMDRLRGLAADATRIQIAEGQRVTTVVRAR